MITVYLCILICIRKIVLLSIFKMFVYERSEVSIETAHIPRLRPSLLAIEINIIISRAGSHNRRDFL